MMDRTAKELAAAQPLPSSEAAGTIAIDVAAKLLMVTPEWVRRLTKDGWIAKTERGRYRVVDVVQGRG
jgi:predicted transcriptional regulator of viral defense system